MLNDLDEKWYFDSLCDGEPRKAIAAAVVRKEWTLALLLAQTNANQNVIRFIAQQIDRGLFIRFFLSLSFFMRFHKFAFPEHTTMAPFLCMRLCPSLCLVLA